MDLVTAMRAGSTVLTLLIFVGVVWWAYGAKRKSRFDAVAMSVLHDEDAPVAQRSRQETSVSDFSSEFWSVYIAVITVVSILACGALLWRLSTQRIAAGQKADVMGHVWDENLEEYNNPLPQWWMWLFYITIVFGLVYLALYPGLGSFPGILKWSSHSQYDAEQSAAKAKFEPIYAKYAAMSIPEVAADPQAREIGQRLFLNYCAQCHASDARGGKGFPNLTDNDWLYGGDPDTIVATITNGRSGIMPAWGKVVGDEGVGDLAQYVKSLSGKDLRHDTRVAREGAVSDQLRCLPRCRRQGQSGARRTQPDRRHVAVRRGRCDAARDHRQRAQRRDAALGRVPGPGESAHRRRLRVQPVASGWKVRCHTCSHCGRPPSSGQPLHVLFKRWRSTGGYGTRRLKIAIKLHWTRRKSATRSVDQGSTRSARRSTRAPCMASSRLRAGRWSCCSRNWCSTACPG